jgi:triosephosphate isomerase (TIM)
MRKKIVAGNWKMNTTLADGIKLATDVNNLVEKNPAKTTVIVAPPFTHLTEIGKLLTKVFLSAQNCASESSGAFTGEVSVGMIKSAGARYVIIGHSERRTYFKEDNDTLFKKTKLALDQDLIPIFCCGEILSEREAGVHFDIVKKQLDETVFKFDKVQFGKLVIAYEPVWAIGTGVNATPEQAQEMHKYIRDLIRKRFDSQSAEDTTILYGGSCKPSNASELFKNRDVDGGLIGGASLNAADFMAIIQSVP